MEKKEIETYESKDVEEAAFLRTVGFDFLRTRLSPESQSHRPLVLFVLQKPDDVDISVTLRAYTNRKALVEPKLFAECLRNTSNLLHDSLRKIKESQR